MNGGFTFKCAYCDHCITTLNLDSLHGNRRTQAATIMNQHAALSHVGKLNPTRLGRGSMRPLEPQQGLYLVVENHI